MKCIKIIITLFSKSRQGLIANIKLENCKDFKKIQTLGCLSAAVLNIVPVYNLEAVHLNP